MKKIVRNVVMLLAATVILSGCSKKASDGIAESSGQTEGKAVSSKSVEKALCGEAWVRRGLLGEWYDEEYDTYTFNKDGTVDCPRLDSFDAEVFEDDADEYKLRWSVHTQELSEEDLIITNHQFVAYNVELNYIKSHNDAELKKLKNVILPDSYKATVIHLEDQHHYFEDFILYKNKYLILYKTALESEKKEIELIYMKH